MRTTALVATCALAACSSAYYPQARNHVAMTMQDGKLVYVRDGRPYPHGMLGGGLVDAVQGNPAAVAAATEYHSHLKTGVIATIVGAVAAVAGSTYIGIRAADSSNGTGLSSSDAAIGVTAMLGGLVIMMVGTGYLAGAEPYRWDAINLFNDAADMPQGGPPGYAPQAKATLKMRDE
jgi:hypothetical protein